MCQRENSVSAIASKPSLLVEILSQMILSLASRELCIACSTRSRLIRLTQSAQFIISLYFKVSSSTTLLNYIQFFEIICVSLLLFSLIRRYPTENHSQSSDTPLHLDASNLHLAAPSESSKENSHSLIPYQSQ